MQTVKFPDFMLFVSIFLIFKLKILDLKLSNNSIFDKLSHNYNQLF